MQQETCLSIRDGLLAYLGEFTGVVQGGEECTVTVPINTLDNRWVDVFVEEKSANCFWVHDAGKSADELLLQGMSLSERQVSIFREIASRYGVNLVEDSTFGVPCTRDLLHHSIWAVAQSSNIAMAELLRHRPSANDDSTVIAVGQIITSWNNENGESVKVRSNVASKGRTAQHVFDFVVSDSSSTVAINVLNPASGSLAKAERYGYQALDLADTIYDRYKRMAILAKPEMWSSESKRIISKMARGVVEFHHPINSRPSLIKSLEGLLAA